MVFPIYIGLDRSVFTEYAERIELLEKDTEIIKGLDILAGFERIYPLPSANKSLYVKVNGRLIRDTFDHEIILTILNNGKLSVFSGCSHSGVINILEKVSQKYPDFKINNVFGGFHIFNPVTHITEKPDYIISLVNKLYQNEGIFYTGHCTGEKGFRIMKRILRDKLNRFRTGTEINLS